MSACGLFLTKMRTIQCKFTPRVVVPQEAVAGLAVGEPFYTMDGKVCTAKFISGWNNDNGDYDEVLNDICMDYWNVPFAAIRSVWIDRVGRVGSVWHLIELQEKC